MATTPTADFAPTSAVGLRARAGVFLRREGLVVLVLGAWGVVLWRVAPLLVNQDAWVALVSGREVAQHGIPHHDSLAVMSLGRRWIDQQWLGQLILYAFMRLGGIRGVILAQVVLSVGAFAAAAFAARRRGGSARSVALIAAVAFSIAPWAAQVRAQSLALPLFVGVYATIVLVPRPTRWSLLLLPVLALWANVHGSVLLGAVLVCAYGLLEIVRAARLRQRPPAVALCLVAAPLMVFASPYGLDVFHYYRTTALNPVFGRLIVEWAPAKVTLIEVPFFLFAFGAVALGARQFRLLAPIERIALPILLAAGLFAVRNFVWFGLAALVSLPALLDAELGPMRSDARRERFNALLGGTAVVVLLLATAVSLSRSRADFESRPAAAARAAARAAAADPSLRIYPDDANADWLLWEEPSLRGRIAYDIRFELLTSRELDRLARYDGEIGSAWTDAAKGYRMLSFGKGVERVLERDILKRGGAHRVYHSKAIDLVLRDH